MFGSSKLALYLSSSYGYVATFYGDSYIQPVDLFFMGGTGLGYIATTPLRGYEDQAVGPRNANGDIIGGRAMAKQTLELRIALAINPIPIYVLGFVEGGNVYESLSRADFFDLRRSAGFGARLQINPIGMIGFDYGYGFDDVYPRDGKARWLEVPFCIWPGNVTLSPENSTLNPLLKQCEEVMKTRMSILSLVLVALVAAPTAFSQQQKIGYVNSAKIFQELPAAQDAQRRIDAMSRPVQDSLEAMQRDLQVRYEDYQKREALLNDAAKKTEQQRLIEQERRMNEYRVQKLGNDGDLARETEKLLNPLRDRIKAAISTVAKEEKYSFRVRQDRDNSDPALRRPDARYYV